MSVATFLKSYGLEDLAREKRLERAASKDKKLEVMS
jgi:hypothetical protein